ncbi:MAG: TspO/MBR family protein [bacterium]
MNIKAIISNKKNILILAFSLLICEIVWAIGVFTDKFVINDASLVWYKYLFKPAFNPSVSFYQVVWLIISLLTGIALYFILNSKNTDQQVFLDKLKKIGINPEPYSGKSNKKLALILFGIQLILSALIIPAFFGLMSNFGGLATAFLVCLSAFAVFYNFYKISIPAAFLMVPSVLWSAYLVGLYFTFWLFNNAALTIWLSNHIK